jgi:hypothetical protein
MANFNTGLVASFNNGGSFLVGSDTLINYVAGSLEIDNPGPEHVLHMDRGAIMDAYYLGDRPARITVKMVAADLSTTASSLMDKLMPAATTGKPTYFATTFKRPWFRGATAPNGDQATFPNCYCESAPKFKDGGPGGLDEVEFTLICKDPPTPAAMWIAMA